MNENQTTQTFTLDELCSLTETSKRTVRFYMQTGLVNRPIGQKRVLSQSLSASGKIL
jgi:hypothetical protein